MTTRAAHRERYSFGNLSEVLELPDLIAVQRESFKWLLDEGLAQTFRDISPIKDFTETLQLELEFDPDDEDLRPPPKFTVEECKEKDMTYSAPIFVRARFMNANTGEIKEQTVFMGDFPMMTDKGTFIINGTERVVVSQLVRSPGVIFQPGERFRLRNLSKHQLVTGTVHPYRGEWIEFDVEQKPGKDVTAGARVARKRRISLFTLLRALGYDEENEPGFLDRFVDYFDFLEGQWEKDKEIAPTQEEALLEIYKRARPGEPPTVESARAYFRNAFFEPRRYDLSRVGRYKLNRKLGPELDFLEFVRGFVANVGVYLHFYQKLQPASAIPWLLVTGLAIFFFGFGLVIGLYKDIPDLSGDRQFGIRTFTVRLGPEKVFSSGRLILTGFYLVPILASLTLIPGLDGFVLLFSHLIIVALFWSRSRSVDPSEPAAITRFYMFLWSLFYAEYLLLSLNTIARTGASILS